MSMNEIPHFLKYFLGDLLISNEVSTQEIIKAGLYSRPGNYILQHGDLLNTMFDVICTSRAKKAT